MKITIRDTRCPIPWEIEFDIATFNPEHVAKTILEVQEIIFKVIDILAKKEKEETDKEKASSMQKM